MSNQKLILRERFGDEALLWPALFPLQRQLPAIFSKSSLEYTGNQRLHHCLRLLTAGVEHNHDEHPTRIFAAMHLVSFASDRTTSFVL
jgi:hypothetical protein